MKCFVKNNPRRLRWHLLQPLAITFVFLWLGTMILFTSNTCNNMDTKARMATRMAQSSMYEHCDYYKQNYASGLGEEARHILSGNLSSLSLGQVVYLVFLGISGDMHTKYLENQKEWAFPYVTLEEAVAEGTPLRMYNDQEMLSFDKFKHSLLAPEQYETAQGAMVTLPDGTQQEYRLYLDYLRTVSPEVAKVAYYGKIAERQKELEEYRKNWEENTSILHVNKPNAYDYVRQETLDDPALDDLYAFTYPFSDREHPNVYYVGRCDEQVFTLMCSGGMDGETALAVLTQRLAGD